MVNEPLFGCFDRRSGIVSPFFEREVELGVEGPFWRLHLVRKKIM